MKYPFKFSIFLILIASYVPTILGHTILGTDTKLSGTHQIISYIKSDDLRIRHTRAMYSKMCAGKTQDYLELDGPMNPDAPYVIEKLLQKIKSSPKRCRDENGDYPGIQVFLNSGGGFMKDGYALGEIFREMGATTRITGTCYSSCATAFLGGSKRVMDDGGELMFHAPFRYSSEGEITCLRRGEYLKYYMKKMIGDENGDLLHKRTMRYCSQSSGWTLNKGAAEVFGLLN